MIQARWWKKNRDIIYCNLCFRGYNIKQSFSGKCGVRINKDGVLISLYLGNFVPVPLIQLRRSRCFTGTLGNSYILQAV